MINPVTRVSNILLRPNAEWAAIAVEPATPASIVAGYVAPLAAIGPIAAFVGLSVVGVGLPFVGTYRVGFVTGLTNAAISYVFAILGVFLIAAIVNVLAPSFGAQKSWLGALKVTAYSMTPAFVAGALGIFPPLAILGILAGFYGIYLLFVGLPVVMGATREKAPIYALSVVGCAIVLGIAFGSVSAALRVGSYALGGGFAGAHAAAPDRAAAEVAAASMVGAALGGGSTNQAAAQQAVGAVASAAAEADAADRSGDADAKTAAGLAMLKAVVTGGKSNVVVVPRTELESLLPSQLGDMQRGDARAESGSFAGMKGSKAGATYKDANGSLEIDVSDLGNVGGLAAMAGTAANLVESEDNDGYEKNVETGGMKVHESWKIANKHSELFSIVDGRFAVGVTGDGVDMDTALKALASVDIGKIRDMAANAK